MNTVYLYLKIKKYIIGKYFYVMQNENKKSIVRNNNCCESTRKNSDINGNLSREIVM